MAYDFSISGSTLVVTLDTESGKFAESITVYSQPNLVLGNDRIFLKQEGLFLQEFTFENIGDINGDTATNLISAYELLDSLIKSIFVTTAQVDSRPYKVYTALLTQSGTDAPVAKVLENTLGTVTFIYEGTGLYRVEFAAPSGILTTKLAIIPGKILEGALGKSLDYDNIGEGVGTISFNLITKSDSSTVADNVLLFSLLEIRVYN